MKYLFRLSVVLLSLFLLNACAGNSGGDDDNSTNESATTHSLKKTGQTKSYDNYGYMVTDGRIKDDGYYQKGVAPEYSRDDAKEIVIDHVTGLKWQDNIAAKTVEKNWAEAKNYCQNLSLGGYTDWRLPTVDELIYIVDFTPPRYTSAAIDTTVFQNTRSALQSALYWSSSLVVDSESFAWSVDFKYGSGEGDDWDHNSYYHNVRCVRGKEINNTNRYTRSDSGIVTDHKTMLQWQDDYSDNSGDIKSDSFAGAISYCERLSLGSYNDWRLPNLLELYYLADRNKRDPAIDPVFINTISGDYWSSTTGGNKEIAYNVDFSLGYISSRYKSRHYNHVRCVRGGE